MTISLGVIMDPIAKINPAKDSTLAMLLAAQKQGWSLFYIEQPDLYLQEEQVWVKTKKLTVKDNPDHWYDFQDKESVSLPMQELDVVLMRKDPPFNMDYIYSTYLLERAEQEGVLVVNRASSLRSANEKLFTLEFPQCTTPTLVSTNQEDFKVFLTQYQDIIVKPLDGMGGTSIFRLKADDPNFSVVIETMTDHGKRLIMAQKFIPEITAGDKRILLVNSKPVPYALARIPAKGEVRGNLAAGGRGEAVALSKRDYWICEQIAPRLKALGLLFVGIDVIGDYLTEINITSPTCIREIDKAHNLDIAGDLIKAIANQLANKE